MGSVIKAEKIDEILWNRHRRTIEHLYVKEQKRLDNEGGVMEYMRKKHNFTASKSQYELHFKKWGLRKNLTRREWRMIIKFLRSGVLRSEPFELLFNGVVLSKERIAREMARHRSMKEKYEVSNKDLCNLPEGVIIQPLTSLLNPGPSKILLPEQGLSIGLHASLAQPVASHALSCFDLVRTSTTATTSYSTTEFASYGRQNAPFFWSRTVDWDTILRSIRSSQQLTKWKLPATMQLDALFYPKLPNADARMILPLYLTTTLLNHMAQSGRQTLDESYALLKTLPRPLVSRFLEALPGPIFDAFRERIFVSAVRKGDTDTVLAMLALDVDAHARIMDVHPYRGRKSSPIEVAIAQGHFSTAKAIVSHICRGATRSTLDELLLPIFVWCPDLQIYNPARRSISTSEHVELLCFPLRAGAEPVHECISAVKGDFSLARKLFETRIEKTSTWLRESLLEISCGDFTTKPTGILLNDEAMSYFFHEHLQQLNPGDPELTKTLLNVWQDAIEDESMPVIEIILHALNALGYHLNNISDGDIVATIMQACREKNWALADSLLKEKITPENTLIQYEDPDTVLRFQITKRHRTQLRQAVAMNDLERVRAMLKTYRFDHEATDNNLRRAIKLGYDEMAITIVQQVHTHYGDVDNKILILLETNQTAVIGALLMRQTQWKAALAFANELGDFDALSNLVFSMPSSVPYFSGFLPMRHYRSIEQLEIKFRALAYHASETNDDALLRWLLEAGMDLDELLYTEDTTKTRSIGKRPATKRDFRWNTNCIVLDSLLAVAAEKNRLPWINILLAEGADCRDSMALLRAVKCKSEAATIDLLLRAAESEKRSGKRPYGSAALQEAIRTKDFGMINMLCDRVDIDMVESSTEDWFHGKLCISPMGMAIRNGDVEIVRILLQKGANPNSLVSYDDFDVLEHIDSRLTRVSPLLAAIDKQNLNIVKILVENGAEIDYTKNLGLLRTPLQRAAEIGNFDITRYVVDQGAHIDTKPVGNGGTALQLTAMNGYVGIAKLLLELGANPNYLPAAGEGRTAFEAAAEWGRIDMMLLLMLSGVQLDLEVGDPPQSQYERALKFAEKNGRMASKRFVQYLYKQRPEDLNKGDAQMLGLMQSPTSEFFDFTEWSV
ncbi:hypothetical protein BKA66DRAFT_182043 [Pyrenochaeta sp. MPI-SDFR-AT-0127]|nr:hypothetical protein BKA66DRAFT_182043 [Pyrenochaeta sp. MPI-SDFR-AT-0127]